MITYVRSLSFVRQSVSLPWSQGAAFEPQGLRDCVRRLGFRSASAPKRDFCTVLNANRCGEYENKMTLTPNRKGDSIPQWAAGKEPGETPAHCWSSGGPIVTSSCVPIEWIEAPAGRLDGSEKDRC